MRGEMKWEDVYKLWEQGCWRFPDILSGPVAAETVFVEYDREGYFYGYDWLENGAAQERKRRISSDPITFLYFTAPSNKGTIQTAQMLAEAEDEEERAAIWIAATSFELTERGSGMGTGLSRCADALNQAADVFLRERYVMWHHAMRKLVPEIMIPYSVLESVRCEQAETVMGLIQMNTLMLLKTYTPLLYTSVKDTEAVYGRIVADHRLHC